FLRSVPTRRSSDLLHKSFLKPFRVMLIQKKACLEISVIDNGLRNSYFLIGAAVPIRHLHIIYSEVLRDLCKHPLGQTFGPIRKISLGGFFDSNGILHFLSEKKIIVAQCIPLHKSHSPLLQLQVSYFHFAK